MSWIEDPSALRRRFNHPESGPDFSQSRLVARHVRGTSAIPAIAAAFPQRTNARKGSTTDFSIIQVTRLFAARPRTWRDLLLGEAAVSRRGLRLAAGDRIGAGSPLLAGLPPAVRQGS